MNYFSLIKYAQLTTPLPQVKRRMQQMYYHPSKSQKAKTVEELADYFKVPIETIKNVLQTNKADVAPFPQSNIPAGSIPNRIPNRVPKARQSIQPQQFQEINYQQTPLKWKIPSLDIEKPKEYLAPSGISKNVVKSIIEWYTVKNMSMRQISHLTRIPTDKIKGILKANNIEIVDTRRGRKPIIDQEMGNEIIKEFVAKYNQLASMRIRPNLKTILIDLAAKHDIKSPQTINVFLNKHVPNYNKIVAPLRGYGKLKITPDLAHFILKAYEDPKDGGYGYSASEINRYLNLPGKGGAVLDILRRGGARVRNSTEQASIFRNRGMDTPPLYNIIPEEARRVPRKTASWYSTLKWADNNEDYWMDDDWFDEKYYWSDELEEI